MLPIAQNKNIIAVRLIETATPERNLIMNANTTLAVTLNAAERELLTQALRDRMISATDVANGFDRAYGPNDGRAREAWTKAHAIHKEVASLAKRLGLPV